MPDTQGSRVKSNLGTPSLQLHESDLVRINNVVHTIFTDIFPHLLKAIEVINVIFTKTRYVHTCKFAVIICSCICKSYTKIRELWCNILFKF